MFTSCTPSEIEVVQKQNNPDAFTSKTVLLSLTPESQKQAWLNRLNSYSKLGLNTNQQVYLKEIILDLMEMDKDKFFLSEDLRQDAVAMAEITPQEDFIKLFCEVTLSLPVLQNNGPICADYIISDLKYDIAPVSNSDGKVTDRV